VVVVRRVRRHRRSARRAILCGAFAALLAPAGAARADSEQEFWPQASAFVQLQPTLRAYLDASYALGKESEYRTGDFTAALDLSLKPILRRHLLTEDWQRSRYSWVRAGYTLVAKAERGEGPQAFDKKEGRLFLALHGKAPLPAEVWLEGRARADLRWIGDDRSTRYRLRLEATRETTVAEHIVVPYANAEVFYDTRYDGWARTLAQAGVEVTADRHLRFEFYLARQLDRLPATSALNALGVVAKFYY
jgi:Protein of unknown function (DUF2490)